MRSEAMQTILAFCLRRAEQEPVTERVNCIVHWQNFAVLLKWQQPFAGPPMSCKRRIAAAARSNFRCARRGRQRLKAKC